MPYYVTNDWIPVCDINILWQVMHQLANLIEVLVYRKLKKKNSKILSATPTFDLA